MMATPASLTIDGANGVALNVLAWRRKAADRATPCLLLHGFGHHSHVWQPLAERLAPGRPVYGLDLRGHGASAADPEARYGHEQLVADLLCCIDALNLPAVHLVGHSLGARVALLFAAHRPERVESLAIVDTGPEISTAGVDRLRDDAHSMPASFASPDAYLAWLKRRYLLANTHDLRHLARHNLRRDTDGWRPATDPAFTDSLWRSDECRPTELVAPMVDRLWEALRAVRCPTLVVRGQISSILAAPVAQRMAAESLADGTLLTVPRAGHAVMLDNPDFLGEGYCDWLARVVGNDDVTDTVDDRPLRASLA